MRKHFSTILKVAVTLAALAIVVIRFDLAAIAATLVGINWLWFWVAFLLDAFSLVVRAYRWLILLHGLGLSIGFGRLVELYFVGNFFNAFLPSGFGGDVVRVLEVARDAPGGAAAGTVIVDRLTGLMMLFLMALLALPFRPPSFPDEYFWILVAAAIGGLAAGFLLLEGSTIRRLGRWLPGPLSPVGNGLVARVLRAVHGSGWPAIARAMVVSLLFNLMLVGWWAASGEALGVDLPFSHYLLAAPIMSMILLLPSIGGLGVRELVAPSLFAVGSVSAEEAIAIALLVSLIMRLASLVGGPVYLVATLRDRRRDGHMQAEA